MIINIGLLQSLAMANDFLFSLGLCLWKKLGNYEQTDSNKIILKNLFNAYCTD
jgi:hypothetical protein